VASQFFNFSRSEPDCSTIHSPYIQFPILLQASSEKGRETVSTPITCFNTRLPYQFYTATIRRSGAISNSKSSLRHIDDYNSTALPQWYVSSHYPTPYYPTSATLLVSVNRRIYVDLSLASSRSPHSCTRSPHARGAQEWRNTQWTFGYMRYMDESYVEGGCANKSCESFELWAQPHSVD
jgi:hypothetical protein